MTATLYYGQDKKAGKLLSPPQIAHAAVRLAIADYNGEHSSEPAQQLRDRLGLGLDDARVLLPKIEDKLRALIAPPSGGTPSCLQTLFQRLRGTLEYRYEDNGSSHQESTNGSSTAPDFRLPLPLLARIGERRAHIVHNFLVWLYRHPTVKTSEVEVRRRMVRYALVDYFFLSMKDDYRRQAFEACEQASGTFPDIGLIMLAAGNAGENDLRIKPFWEQHSAVLKSPADFEIFMRDEADPVNLDDLLLWAQRDYLHAQFPHYDPTLFFNVAALPWDRDHIWPQAKMGKHGVNLEVSREIRDSYKWRYLHSFGNLRILDRRDNRAAGAELPSQKFAGRDEAERCFAISHDVFDQFCQLALSPEDKITQEFLDALKNAVNARRSSLYRELYEMLCLDELRHEGPTPHQG